MRTHVLTVIVITCILLRSAAGQDGEQVVALQEELDRLFNQISDVLAKAEITEEERQSALDFMKGRARAAPVAPDAIPNADIFEFWSAFEEFVWEDLALAEKLRACEISVETEIEKRDDTHDLERRRGRARGGNHVDVDFFVGYQWASGTPPVTIRAMVQVLVIQAEGTVPVTSTVMVQAEATNEAEGRSGISFTVSVPRSTLSTQIGVSVVVVALDANGCMSLDREDENFSISPDDITPGEPEEAHE